MESERPLYDDMEQEIKRLGEVLQTGNDADYKKYETKLNSLIDSYAEYYLSQYLKCRLSHADSLKKEQILSSEPKRICDTIKDVDILNKTEYENWLNRIVSLKEAKQDVTKASIKAEPYHDFNPREFYDKPTYSIQDLSSQLDEILLNGQQCDPFSRSSAFKPTLMLNEDSRAIVSGFKDGWKNSLQ